VRNDIIVNSQRLFFAVDSYIYCHILY